MTITLSSEVQKMLRLLCWKLNSKTLPMVHHMNAETTCTNTRNSYSIVTFLHDIWTGVNHDVTDVTLSCMVYILMGTSPPCRGHAFEHAAARLAACSTGGTCPQAGQVQRVVGDDTQCKELMHACVYRPTSPECT